ncbi:MAG TPA: SDR family oxidoreductase, partial [Deltaproteobacteria bacterium]|nr:SDR family oxidoreductase [Deltaproteobacteria bacterium]
VPETYSSIYTATKFALRGFNLTLAIELKKHRIGVSTIFPDSVATLMLRHEAEHGGSPLTFLSPPMSPALVAEEILGAIVKNKVEVYVPASTGMVSKAVMCWPWAVTRIWPLLEYLGRRKQPALASQLRRSLPE